MTLWFICISMKFGLLKHAGSLLVQNSGINFFLLLLYFSIKSLISVDHNCLFPVCWIQLVAGSVCLCMCVSVKPPVEFVYLWLCINLALCVCVCFCWEYRYGHGVLGATGCVGTPAKMWMCSSDVYMSSLASSHTAGCFDWRCSDIHTQSSVSHSCPWFTHGHSNPFYPLFFLYMKPVHTLNWRLYKVLFIISNQGVFYALYSNFQV